MNTKKTIKKILPKLYIKLHQINSARLAKRALKKDRIVDKEFEERHPNMKKEGVLIYIGMNKGNSFSSIFRKYETCYGFEADPRLFANLKKRFDRYSNVRLFNVAVADYDGEIEFNISSNGGTSSSIGNFSKDWDNHKFGYITMSKTIKVPCINMHNFLQQNNIDFIDEYISDIQGFDLQALKTLKPYINDKKIKNITCEVAKDKSIYSDLPDNSENGFNLLLNKHYKCVAKGCGILVNGEFETTADELWEMDCKWSVKT